MRVEEMEKYALENNIPIMLKDGIEYLCNFIKENKIKNILEIGSAIGYSSIKMALIDKDIKITTIEKDYDRYIMAIDNIKYNDLNNQIDIIYKDAKDVKLTKQFDLIFIDASKGNNKFFFEKFQENLSDNGVIITDNLSFHGLVEDENLIKTKNQRGIVKKIKDYLLFLDSNNEFITEYISIGDKISISKRKDQ